MYLKIHRGTTQIGGNIIEIGTNRTRLIFDAGANLPPLDDYTYSDNIEIAGLTYGEPGFDAVFISHHHNDHCGLLDRILPEIPVWSGRETARIVDVIADFTGGLKGRISHFFSDGGNSQPTVIGDITVTPIGVDHSACAAYMFLIQADGKNVLYTGDYRAAGEVPDVVQHLIGAAGKLDALIGEGTNIRAAQRAGISRTLRDEAMVEEEASKLMKACEGTVFVLCSSTNEPRISAIHAACKRAGRIACHDLFLTAVRGDAVQRDECKTQAFVANFVSKEKSPRVYPYFKPLFDARKLVRAESLAKYPSPQTIFIRTSMLPFLEKYLKNRGGKGHVLIYSVWEGYKPTVPVQKLMQFCEAYEINTVSLHCSGHAYCHDIKGLIWQLNPKVLIPVHCDKENRTLFEALHHHCVMLLDGERMEV